MREMTYSKSVSIGSADALSSSWKPCVYNLVSTIHFNVPRSCRNVLLPSQDAKVTAVNFGAPPAKLTLVVSREHLPSYQRAHVVELGNEKGAGASGVKATFHSMESAGALGGYPPNSRRVSYKNLEKTFPLNFSSPPWYPGA